jgi:hypothetical protein
MADSFVPPAEVRANAKRGLELRAKHGRGGTEIGVARARDLSNGKALPLSTVNRMVSYFARHEVDKKGEGWGVDSAGYIAWLLWGGDAGKSWANRIANEQRKEKSMTQDLTTTYAEIIKADRNPDGTMTVYGKATDDSIDIDQQICDADWLGRAMPDWFKTGGNIREQHSSIAAGVATDYEAKTDGHYISALVVDPISAKKVETGVLKGFSIGIKNPRVVRDTKAVNGRIIDGQIVEVSLVDRPANPNCQLVLAKSVQGEVGMWKVEELIIKEDKKPDYEALHEGGDNSEPADKELYNRIKAEAKKKFDVYPSAYANAWLVREYKARGGKYKRKTEKSLQFDQDTKEIEMATAKELIEVAKSYAGGDVLKFDQKLYDTARQALAQLIAVEATEMVENNSSEEFSISQLLEAVHHLFAWYEGEEAEGETGEQIESGEGIEMSAKSEHMDTYKESTAGCKCAGCMKCAAAGGCAEKMCSMHIDAAKEAEKSADTVDKCLECGCHKPEETHGRSDVSTAEIVTPDEAPKSAEADETVAEEATEETKENSEEAPASPESVEALVEKAVKSALEALKPEITALKSANEAANNEVVSLKSELATAMSKAVAGGPRRTVKPVDTSTNDLLVKAATYKAKAQATTDPDLAKGYTALYEQFVSKANEASASN